RARCSSRCWRATPRQQYACATASSRAPSIPRATCTACAACWSRIKARHDLNFNCRRDGDVVGGLLPATCLFADVDVGDPVAQLRRYPNVVEAAALVDGGPVRRAVAPPSV